MSPRLRAVEEAPEGYPVHPLFATSKNVEPLLAPIETIDVMRITKGRPRMLGWAPIDELPDEMAIEERYGPGDYELVGRTVDRSRILRRVHLSVGEPETDDDGIETDETPATQPQPAAPAPAQGGVNVTELFGLMMRETRESKEREAKMMMMFINMMQQNSTATLTAITQLTAARVADQREIVQALATSKAAPAQQGFNPEILSEMFAQGLAIGEERASSNGDMDGIASIAKTFVEGMAAAKQQSTGDA